MEVLQLMSLLSLRPLLNKLARTPGNERAEQVVALLADLSQDAAGPLARALRQASSRAWEVVEIALAGDGFWNGCRIFLSEDELEALRRQVVKLRAQTPLAGDGQSEGLRRLCLGELQSARKSGLLTGGEPDLGGLVARLGPLAHYEDPQRLPEIEWEAAHRLAGELRRAGLNGLAQFADGGRGEGVPILIAAVRHALCQEIAAAPELSRRLVWESYCDLPAEQQEALALLAQTLSRHGRGLREWLDEDVSAPPTPKAVHAHASSAEGQAAPAEAAAPTPTGSASRAEPDAGAARPAASLGADAEPAEAAAEPPPTKPPATTWERVWGWLMPLLVLGLPILMVVWLLRHYSVTEVRRFVGHTELVTSVAFSPNGQYALSGSADETVRLWDVASGEQVRFFRGHTGGVNSVAFAPDGKQIVVGAEARAYLWDVDTGQQIRQLDTPTNFVLSVAFSPDGKQLLTTSKADHKIRLWDVATGKQVRVFEGHTGPVNRAVFAPDGTRIASAGDTTVRLWDAATGKELRQFQDHKREVKTVTFAPDGRLLASGGADHKVLLWETADAKKVGELTGSGGAVVAVAFTPDGTGLAGGSLGATASEQERQQQTKVQRRNLRLWDVRTGREVYNFEDCDTPIWSVAVSPDGNYLLSGGTEGAVRLWVLH